MALKYWLEFTSNNIKPDNTYDIIVHRCEIYNDDFTGDATQIYGSVILNKVSDKDILKPTRGGGLRLNLEANTNLTFEDFQTAKERDFLVKYYRDEILHSNYWLSPEGLYEDFVSDKWIISLDCTDGLGFLNNLSYVDNTTKNTFQGKQSMLEVIANCLIRTNIEMYIYTSVNVFQSSVLNFNTNTLVDTYVNANRYIKDDNNTIMNCAEVLESILEMFGAVITQYEGGWYIFKPNDLYNNTELTFYGYYSNGTALNPTTYTINFSKTIGSSYKEFYPHHINTNQQFSRISPIGAYRINYKYGVVKSFFDNTDLISDNGIIQDWIINSPSNLRIPLDQRGVIITGSQIPTTQTLQSSATTVQQGDSLSLEMIVSNIYLSSESSSTAIRPKVILTDSVNTYYLNRHGQWSSSDDSVFFDDIPYGANDSTSFTMTTNITPMSGSVYVFIYSPHSNVYSEVLISKIDLRPKNTQEKIGQIFTFENIENNSAKIESNKTVYNGDVPSDVFVGTIYESDKTTPTERWYRNDGNFLLRPLIQIMGEDRMAMYSGFSKVYKGDVLGYIDFLSVITIDGFSQKFMPIEYSFDASTNITTLKLLEINNDIGTNNYGNIKTSSSFDYGNVVEPTIK